MPLTGRPFEQDSVQVAEFQLHAANFKVDFAQLILQVWNSDYPKFTKSGFLPFEKNPKGSGCLIFGRATGFLKPFECLLKVLKHFHLQSVCLETC